jgi:hypothetical protein
MLESLGAPEAHGYSLSDWTSIPVSDSRLTLVSPTLAW